MLAEQRVSSGPVDIIKVVREIDSYLSKYEELIWRLVNFDNSVLEQIEDSIKDKGGVKKVDVIVLERALLPHIYVFENNTYLYIIGLHLTKAGNLTLSVVEDRNEQKYIEVGSVYPVYYPISKANIETSLLLIMSSDELLHALSRFIHVHPAELRKYIERSITDARDFYAGLKQIPVNRLTSLTFSDGYKTFVTFKDREGGVKLDIEFDYYNIDAALWSYYGVSGVFVTSAERFENLVSRNDKAVECLLELREILSEIEIYVSAAYLLTKMIENILP